MFYRKHLQWCSKISGRLIRQSVWKPVALVYKALTGKMYEYLGLLPCSASHLHMGNGFVTYVKKISSGHVDERAVVLCFRLFHLLVLCLVRNVD